MNDLAVKFAKGPPLGISPSSLLKDKLFGLQEFFERYRNKPKDFVI